MMEEARQSKGKQDEQSKQRRGWMSAMDEKNACNAAPFIQPL
jgi:hypothetical protein